MAVKPVVKPIGIGDLKVVKQKLARYEAGEIAHIENVLESETRGREHRRLRQIEEIVTEEIEREEESRRDLQSTERFELQQESQTTIKNDTSFQAGLEVSAGYGPVSLSAFAKFAMSSSKEESDKQSTKYAKDITERSLSRLLEKVRKERTTRTLEEFEEKNTHGFDNTDGDGNISGIYRWVDKYYRNKVIDYGRRLMYEFYVPEPAAFFLFASKYNLQNNILPEKPEAPLQPGSSTTPLSPDHVSRTNYLGLVKRYAAQGVKPPPPSSLIVSKAIAKEIFDNDAHWAFADEELTLPKGYKANWGAYAVWWTWRGGDDRTSPIQVGVNRLNLGDYPALNFMGESEFVPVTGTGYGIRSMALNIEVSCELSAEAFQAWQLGVFNAVMNAYHKSLLDYEEKLAATQIQQGVAIGGNNPAINRQIEQEELKKACLTLWSTYAFNNPPGINHFPSLPIPGNYPEIHQANAKANVDRIRMFEDGLEWRNITYEFFPFFWGRKAVWLDTYSIESPDPVFESFLKAGAARVRVPVKPSFTEAILYYQVTGEFWDGGPIPELSGPPDSEVDLYNSYIEEMEGIEDLPDIDKDVPLDPADEDTWISKVPTTLVWLQGDSTLPDFES